MGIQAFIEGKKYRIFVEGSRYNKKRNQYTETFYGTRKEANKRFEDLVKIRDSNPDAATMRWPKLLLPPNTYAKLILLSNQVEQSPEQFMVDIISAMAEDLE